MPRIPQKLRERGIGMHNTGMTMNAVAMNIGCSRALFDTLGNVFKQQDVRKIDHVVDVCASRRVAKTAIFGTPTCAIASKLPQLLLLTPMVHITVYLPNVCPTACTKVG